MKKVVIWQETNSKTIDVTKLFKDSEMSMKMLSMKSRLAPSTLKRVFAGTHALSKEGAKALIAVLKASKRKERREKREARKKKKK